MCKSLNTTNASLALECAARYTAIYDGIVTVLHRDHPQLQFTGLVLAWPDCAGSEQWFRFFLNASNHRSPVRENFDVYVSEISYHWYAENAYAAPAPQGDWQNIGANPADVFLQSAQFLVSARMVKDLIRELHPARAEPGPNKLRVFCNEVGVLVGGPPPQPFGAGRWWWNLEAAMFGYVYASLAALGVDAIAASQLTGYEVPENAPSISMLDWNTGHGTAWFWVVQMFTDTLGSGPKDVLPTLVNGALSNQTVRPFDPTRPGMCAHSMNGKAFTEAHVQPLFAQAFALNVAGVSKRIVILVNTRNCSAAVVVAGAAGGSVRAVDLEAGFGSTPYKEVRKTPNWPRSWANFSLL